MTRAPAPEYVQAPRHSDWQRPTLPSKVKVPQVVIRQHIMPLLLLRVRNLLSNN